MKKFSKKRGTYYLAAWRAKDITGKMKVHTERYDGKDGKRGAQKLATLREAEAANDSLTANRHLTLSKFLLGTWLPRNTLGKSYSTRYSKERICLDISEILGDLQLSEVTAFHLSDIQVALNRRGLASSTINNYMKVAKRALRDASTWGLIDGRPWEGVPKVEQKKAPPRVVTREQALRAEEQLREGGDDYSADLIILLTYTGLRLSEALGLHWEDIDWGEETARIWRITVRTDDTRQRIKVQEHPKTSAGHRTLPLAKPVIEMLKRRQTTTDSELVFPDPRGLPMYSSVATKPINKTFRDLGVRGTTHGLRHGALTRFLEKGVPLNQVSRIAGHESTQITAQTYLAWADDSATIGAMRAVMDD